MEEVPQTPAADALDFDRAQVTSDAPSMLCKACGAAIVNAYYSIGDQFVCATCRHQIETARDEAGSFGEALLRGGGAALLGAAAYYGIVALTGYEIGIVAVVVGVFVGKAVRKGAGARDGFVYRGLALALTYMAITATYVPMVMRSEDVHSIAGAMLLSLMLPGFMLVKFENVMGLVILGIGLYEAYKLSAPNTLQIQGPFALGSVAPAS